MPVYDKSVYDYDIFDGVPGLNTSGSVNYDVFSTVRDRSRSKTMRMMIFLGVLGGRIWSRRDSKMSRMLGLDLMICFMGLVGLVFQVIGIDFYVGLFSIAIFFGPNMDTFASIWLIMVKLDRCLLFKCLVDAQLV